ncbi:MAG: TonB-dependent receptor [Pseudomonadota bacterium]
MFSLSWCCALLGSGMAAAQEPPATETPASTSQRIEITGGRQSDTEQRRQSTAAKIVIGREEIERFGDSTLSEVLKRLPGVTVSGAPGRGGGIRMRGLGAGYTQILLDGQAVPRGFSLDGLDPEQVERIEILRAPTAETGARAIAGTINIVTREGFTQRMNDLRIAAQVESGRVSPSVSWTRNGGQGPFSFNVSMSAHHSEDTSTSTTSTRIADASGGRRLQQHERARSESRRDRLHLGSRLQWRLNERGDSLTLMPFVVHSRGSSDNQAQLASTGTLQPGDADYDHARTEGDSRFTLARLNGQARQLLDGGTRLEWRFGLGLADSRSQSLRREFDAGDLLTATQDERLHSRERSASLALKSSRLLDNDHSLVGGAELEATRRSEASLTNGEAASNEGDNLRARTERLALYAQDEWRVTPQWAAHAGLRWETIATRGDAAEGPSPHNRSSVLTPLLHAVWKPDPKGRDQVRISLTRSYKSPSLSSLIARTQVSANNAATRPDRQGNPDLKPELASGIDLALEHYLPEGGLLSANVFHRHIRDYIRTQVSQQGGRWVARPENIGGATAQGLELEAKFRLDSVWAGALPVDLRFNGSVFRSKVHSVPGPDNRLDQQPRGSANIGADGRVKGTPLMLGGNLGLTPATTTRVSQLQTTTQSRKRVFDAYALWSFDPALKLRASASNLAPLDYEAVNTVALETASTVTAGSTRWRVQLEMKL